MKYLISIFLLITNVAIAQKPSQKDLQNAMKEYEKMMNDPQIKKLMQDSVAQKYMGKGKMPADSKALQQQMNFAMQHVSQQQQNKIFGTETLPKKDVARIAALPKAILSNEQFKAYLQKVKIAVQKKISAENKNLATQFLAQISAGTNINYSIAAVACLNKAKQQAALYILSEAVTQPNLDVNDVNNFAALLNINGGEHLALPILQKINTEYPSNSTVLNNIGQSWFGLGDFNKSEKYIDSSLHFFAGNAEANYTKCYLELQKGNTQQAIDYLIKAIQNGYSSDKEAKLKKLGKKLTSDMLKWNLPKPADPLGINSILVFRPEDFYTDINGQNSLADKWKDFEQQIANTKQSLEPEFKNAANNYAATFQQMISNPSHTPVTSSFIQIKAGKMADALTADFNDYMTRTGKEKLEIFKDVIPDEIEINKKLGKIRDETNNDQAAFCQAAIPLVDNFLAKYNPLIESYSATHIKRVKVYVNDMAYLGQFIYEDDNVFNAYLYSLKAILLDALYSYPGRSLIPTAPVYFELEPKCVEHKKLDITVGSKLPDFDSVHCNTHIVIGIPGVCSARFDCNKETDDCELGPVHIKYNENLSTGDYNAHAEVSISKSIGLKQKGIFTSDFSAGISDYVEWNNKGVTDVGITATAGIDAGISTEVEVGEGKDKDTYSIEKNATVIGVEAKISILSGPSLSGEGILHGVEINGADFK
ncbi:MAG: hypothetical protein KGL19_13690 [Bacteroidota bacterium]|nr:hypothetical protein [Bacteroidota bacterium]